jgi:CTD nuclear envelope phosphatase 1
MRNPGNPRNPIGIAVEPHNKLFRAKPSQEVFTLAPACHSPPKALLIPFSDSPNMNSLTYISRRFDILASTRAPPNTPSTEYAPHPSMQLSPSLDDPTTSQPAVQSTTWSLRSLLAPPPLSRRSLSSLPRIPVLPPSSSIRAAICSKPQSTTRSILRRIFFIRLLELVWDVLCAAATSLRMDDVWHGRRFPPRGLGPKSVLVGEKPSIGGRGGTVATPVLRVSSEQAVSPPESVAVSPSSTHSSSSPINPLPDSIIPAGPPVSNTALSSRFSLAYPPPQAFAALMPTPPPSRASTPTYSSSTGLPITPRRTPFHSPKTLILDLDETLIHSTSRPLPAPGIRGLFGARSAASHTVEVVMGGRSTLYHVYKRPFVDFFLRKVRVVTLGHSYSSKRI